MRMESDDENFQNTKIPNHLLINLNIVNRFNNFRINFNIDNLLNEKYFNYAVASSSTNGTYNAYPEPERNFALSLSYEY